MDEAEFGQARPRVSRGVTVLMLAVLVGGACILFYSDWANQLTAGYASILMLIAIPAALGGLLINVAYPEGDLPLMGCFVWPTLGIALAAGLAWSAFGEGAICIAMILPLWIPAAIVGALVNRWNKARADKVTAGSRLNSMAWLALPVLLASGDGWNPPAWRNEVVMREVVVAASPEEIWPLLVSIPAIGRDEGQGNFTQDILGVPRPSEAVLVDRGGRLVRKARWGTDIRFEERITEWRENEAIGWAFAFPDDSVQRYTDRHISPDGPILDIRTGRYELVRQSQGQTLVRLTTQYGMRTNLPAYLSWWGDRLLGDVQSNVLAIVKQRAESGTRLAAESR